jgi:AraC-like DNA-binding protein
MKLHLLNRDNPENSSFAVTQHREPFFLKIWHYHPELELVLNIKGTGTRFVGDSIKKFDEGEVVLIGKNLPHMWLNDELYFDENSNLIVEDIAVHFKKEFLGFDFLEASEMKHISKLLSIARYGIKFLDLDQKVVTALEKMAEMEEGFERTMKFIYVLNMLAKHRNYELLSSEIFVNAFKKNQNEILDKTYEYIFKNFSGPIGLTDVAKIAHMNPSAFSRFFKRVNHKTFSRYLNEVRIGYACKLLIEHKFNIASICYESGFNNISNFNRQFKSIMKMSPTEYMTQLSKMPEEEH